MTNLNNNHWLILGIIALTTALFTAQVQNVDAMHFELLPLIQIVEAHEGEFFGDTADSEVETETTEGVTIEFTIEEKIRAYFADIPIMQDIARCESRFRQFDSAGKPLKNAQGSSATGAMQIMASLHRAPALSLGFDIDTLEGNLGYARYLYEKNGTRDWNASRHCWGSRHLAQR